MQVFENIEVVEGLNISFSDQNTFPKEWLVTEKRQVVIAFQNNENRSMGANTHKIIVEWKQGSNTVHRQEINISLPVGAGTVYRRTHELQPPSTPGNYTVIYSVRHNNGLESVEKQIFENIVVHDHSTSWQISALHDQVEGNLVTWTGRRFDPNRDVDVNIQDDKVAVKVSYHVPMFFPVTRLFGGGDWQPMITVTSEQQVHKEKPAW
ncbi:hypothetical protein GCM10010965_14950 [Caldalkalibacillus thermarum]|nr:hypothetical protein GCM10010965_14950 [Caldalkalibacillus thermarum]